MKNMEMATKMNTLVLAWDEFERIASDIFGEKVEVDWTYGGLEINLVGSVDICRWTKNEICEKFATYFGLKNVATYLANDTDDADELYPFSLFICYLE